MLSVRKIIEINAKWIFFGAWLTIETLLFMFTFSNYFDGQNYSLARASMGQISMPITRASAHVISLNAALLLFPMCKTILTYAHKFACFSWCTAEYISFAHRLFAFSLVIFSAIHIAFHALNTLHMEYFIVPFYPAIRMMYLKPTFIIGHFMVLLLLLMISTVLKNSRSKNYQISNNIHWLWLLFFGLGSIHGAFCFIKKDVAPKCIKPEFWMWILPGFFIYLGDRLYRLFRSHKYRPHVIKVILHPSKVLELQIVTTDFYFKPAQWIYLQVPEISNTEWHPFTITSSMYDSFISVHIRIVGDWTEKLAKILGVSNESFKTCLIKVINEFPSIKIDGPFGGSSENIFNYDSVIMIGAGIGQTPFASILRTIWDVSYKNKKCLHQKKITKSPRKIRFYSVGRESEMLHWFHDILRSIESHDKDGKFEFCVYVTEEFSENHVKNIMINDFEGVCDVLTGLKHATIYGRPNFELLLANDWRQRNLDCIGVFYCGPKAIGNNLKKLCLEKSNLEFYSEYFN